MLTRIKYISRFAPQVTPQDLKAILDESVRNNQKKGVTGVLAISKGLFFQIIEGPRADVEELYKAIAFDRRHEDVLLLNVEHSIPSRLYPDWSMRVLDLDSESRDDGQTLRFLLKATLDARRLQKDLTSTLERAIWKEFHKAQK